MRFLVVVTEFDQWNTFVNKVKLKCRDVIYSVVQRELYISDTIIYTCVIAKDVNEHFEKYQGYRVSGIIYLKNAVYDTRIHIIMGLDSRCIGLYD